LGRRIAKSRHGVGFSVDRGRDQLGQLFECLIDEAADDRLGIGKMSVDRRSGDPDVACDRSQRHGLLAPFLDQGTRGVEDLLAQFGALTATVGDASGRHKETLHP
jgi:hypothetical protein